MNGKLRSLLVMLSVLSFLDVAWSDFDDCGRCVTIVHQQSDCTCPGGVCFGQIVDVFTWYCDGDCPEGDTCTDIGGGNNLVVIMWPCVGKSGGSSCVLADDCKYGSGIEVRGDTTNCSCECE
jgi:hypothetical protein